MADEVRLPPRLEAAALLRRVQAEGGFAAVLQKGEPDAGTILVVLTENGNNTRVYERMPQVDGSRDWVHVKAEVSENKRDFADYLQRRGLQDRDLWIIELDIAGAERFIGLPASAG